MGHRYFDSAGNEYRVYSTENHSEGYTFGKKVAGEVIDKMAKEYMEKTKEKDYSKAVKVVLDKDPDLKAAYIGV